ncbi:hypothetical protein ABT147_35340 [Streptomyces sp. NPDC001868]|uniref:hypothetical protein n=1 Tax=Streptomyces sp. NPDC001868 TaxID=3154401 RepID=UPI00331E6BB1
MSIVVKVAALGQALGQPVLVARFFGEGVFARARTPVSQSAVARSWSITAPGIISPVKVVASFMWG